MNPTASIVAYLLMVVLTILSVHQAIRNNLRVLPGNGDIIVMGFTFGISFFFPGYWLWGVKFFKKFNQLVWKPGYLDEPCAQIR